MTTTSKRDFPEATYTIVYEYWADEATGLPIRSRTATTIRDEHGDSYTVVDNTTYSGIGELNIITAPELPPEGTPEPFRPGLEWLAMALTNLQILTADLVGQRPCTELQANNYRATIIAPIEGGTIFTEMSYSDGNSYAAHVRTDVQGEENVRIEQIVLDGVIYLRGAREPDLEEFGPWEVEDFEDLSHLTQDPLPCFNPSDAPPEERVVDAVQPPDPTGTRYLIEVWFDEQGVPIRARRSAVGEPPRGAPAVIYIDFDAIGEPNEITAPVVGE